MPTLLVNGNFPIPALKLLRARGVQAEAVQELMPGSPPGQVSSSDLARVEDVPLQRAYPANGHSRQPRFIG